MTPPTGPTKKEAFVSPSDTSASLILSILDIRCLLPLQPGAAFKGGLIESDEGGIE